jgi:hypothetical protein
MTEEKPMMTTLERFAARGMSTDGAYWGMWCRRHEDLLARQAAHRAEMAKKPQRVNPNPWANPEGKKIDLLLLTHRD